MFSFSISVPKFSRRRSQPPPKGRRVAVDELPLLPYSSSRSRSIGRQPVGLFVVESDEAEQSTVDLSPKVVDIEPESRSERYRSLPARLKPEVVEISPRRGRRRSRESLGLAPPEPLAVTYHETGRSPRREISSDSRGRRVIVERSTSRRPLLLDSGREASSVRSASRPRKDALVVHQTPERSVSWPRKDSLVVHQTPERRRSRHRRSTSRGGSACSCSPSDGGSSVFSASTAGTSPSVRGSPDSFSNFQKRLDKLSTVTEPPEYAAPSPTKVTRYRYRYTPVEDDVSSVKSLVREMERGRGRTARAASSNATKRASTVDGAERLPPRRTHGRSVSYGQASTLKRTPSFVRLPRSSSVVPSTSCSSYNTPSVTSGSSFKSSPSMTSALGRAPSVTPSTASRAPSAPLPPPRHGRAKFSERFSVCLDDSSDTFTATPSVVGSDTYTATPSMVGSLQDTSDDRRMRRVRRVMKMAEYAAGKR